MAQQERSPINLLLSLGLSLLWMVACNPNRQPHKNDKVIPATYVCKYQSGFHTKEGVLYYQNQSFSGWQYELYVSGDTALLIPFYKGKEQGIARQWYENGQLRELRLYESGEKAGEHLGWWENGKPKFAYHFANGTYEGNQKDWNEVGLLYKSAHYKSGMEEGLQQMWRYDGTLVANYVVKNGRNYGLAGVKNCKSVWENETKN